MNEALRSEPLPGGVTVALGTLNPYVRVRIPAWHPQIILTRPNWDAAPLWQTPCLARLIDD